MLGDSQVFLIAEGYTCQVSYCIYSVAISISSCIKLAQDVILQVSYFQIAQYHYPELFMFLRLNSDFPRTSLRAVMYGMFWIEAPSSFPGDDNYFHISCIKCKGIECKQSHVRNRENFEFKICQEDKNLHSYIKFYSLTGTNTYSVKCNHSMHN